MTVAAFLGRRHHRKFKKSIIPLINNGQSVPFCQRNYGYYQIPMINKIKFAYFVIGIL